MKIISPLSWFCVIAAQVLSAPAQAALITGEFSGRATGVIFTSPESTPFDEPVFGTIRFDTEIDPATSPVFGDEDGTEVNFILPSLELTFTLFGFTSVLNADNGTPLAHLFDDGMTQILRLQVLGPRAFPIGLQLQGGNASLFNDFDLGTFNPAAIDLGKSFGFIQNPPTLSANVALDRLVFADVPTSIPEPVPVLLLIVGCAMLGVARWRSMRSV